MKDEIEIQTIIEKKHPSLKPIIKCVTIGYIACLHCFVRNYSNYFSIYPEGDIKYRNSDYWEYKSGFNDEYSGNGVVFIDCKTYGLIKAFRYVYYKDDTYTGGGVHIRDYSNDYVITTHNDRTHIIFLDNFSVSTFFGAHYAIFGSYILFFPYEYYYSFGTLAILDTKTKRRVDLTKKIAEYHKLDTVSYENIQDFDFYIFDRKIIYYYLPSGKKFEISIDELFVFKSDFDPSVIIKPVDIKFDALNRFIGHTDCVNILDTIISKGYICNGDAYENWKDTVNCNYKYGILGDDILYLRYYHPKYLYKSSQLNPEFDNYDQMILDLKHGNNFAIDYFSKILDEVINDKVIICLVPPSDLNKKSGLREVIANIINRNRVDATSCLVRHAKINKLSYGGERSINIHLKSIRLLDNHLIDGNQILLIDDIVTTGNSLNACKKILLDNGAVKVRCLVLGKTTRG